MEDQTMTFEQALAIVDRHIGLKSPAFTGDAPVAQCWIDRINWVSACNAKELTAAITEANRYSGRM
jgi:hypothetical protein